jgi:hypothetical protein
MSKKYIKEADENFDSKVAAVDEKLKNLNEKLIELNKRISNSKTEATAANSQANKAVGVNPEAQTQDKKMKMAQAAKSIADSRYYQEELKKIKNEISLVNQEKSDLLKNKNTQTENIMAKLTKKDILKMVESSEPARMTKRELVESVTNRLLLSEDMNDDLRRKIERGEHDYSEHIDPETVKRMSDEIVRAAKENIESRGGRANLEGAQELMSRGLMGALQKEARHKRELEQLAIKLVSEEYGVPQDAVDFEAKITGHPQLGGEEIRKTGLKMRKGDKRPPQGKTAEELKPNVTKRRLMNAMMHGAARKGQNLFHMASDDLRRIDPSLAQDYSKLMAGNDFMYWALSDDTIAQESESGVHAGQVKVSLAGPKPKIIAQGMTFPFLLHELTKGVLELISLHGLDVDKETRDYVLDKTDNLESEPMDIRLGVKIWEKLLETMDVDALPYKAQIFTRMSELSPSEFNNIVNGLLNDSEQAKEKVREIVYDVIRENNEDDVEQAMKQFREPEGPSPDDEGPVAPEGPDDEDDELAKLLGKKGGEEEVDDPRTWSKRELENARDEALDNEDYKMVAFYQTILDEKY